MRRFPRALYLLLVGAFVNRAGTFVVPFLALWLTEQRQFTDGQAGRTLALFGLGSTLAGPLGGVLTDRIGRHTTAALGMCASALFMLCILNAPTTLLLLAAIFLVGLGGDIFRPAMNAAVADLTTPEERPRAFGYVYWAHNLGFAIAMPLGGLLVHGGFGRLFVADAATSLVFAAVLFVGVGETRSPQLRSTAEPRDFGRALRDGPFVVLVVAMMLNAIVFLQSMVALPLALRDQGIDAERYGELIAVNGVLIVLLQPFAESVFGRARATRRLAASVAVVGIGFGLQLFCRTPLAYAGAIAVWTLGEVALGGVGPAVVSRRAPPALRGTYQGVFQLTWSVAALVAPLVGPALLQRYGATTLWLSCTATSMVAALLLLLLGEVERPRA